MSSRVLRRFARAICGPAACLAVVACVETAAARAGDWPMWRGDAARTATTDEQLPDALHLQWVRDLPPQETAWKDEEAMKFDAGYLPVVLDGKLLLGSTVTDCVTAYDLETGRPLWRFYTEGPVRVAPAAMDDRVYVASDDGCLYCLGAADGKLRWKFRGGPSDRRLIGNGRLISTWPCRGGPVVADGRVYFAAGIWPFMGTFIYALDARSGQTVWRCDGTSFTFRRLPHRGAVAFSGLSPQGHLAVVGERLIVPGSRLTPAVLDRRTGKFLHYARGSGPAVAAAGRWGFAGGQIFEVDTGWAVRLGGPEKSSRWVVAPDAWYASRGIYRPESIDVRLVDAPSNSWDIRGHLLVGKIKGQASLPAVPWLRAGSRLVAGRGVDLQLLDVSTSGAEPRAVWQGRVDGSPCGVAAAQQRLVVTTLEGRVYCFGPQEVRPKTYRAGDQKLEESPGTRPSGWADRAREILKLARADGGYCLVWGLKDGGLVEPLIEQSNLEVIAVDPDAGKIDALRRRLDGAGLYGRRASAIVGDPLEIEFAPYLASLIVSEDPRSAGLDRGRTFVEKLFGPLQPYGGAACLPLSADGHRRFAESAGRARMPGGEVRRSGGYTLLVRPGPLPGSAPWMGQNADAGNTRSSRDELVMAPLGVLWFGNSLSNRLVLPRHGEGPVEQVVGGRLFIEGPESLSAADVYTGRLLWTREFPDLGHYYNSTKHQPGAHSIGSNFFAAADAVYVSAGESCHVLDPASGRTRRELKLPGGSIWQFLLVYEDLLVAGADPVIDERQPADEMYSPTSSRRLVVMDRQSGEVRWTRNAEKSFAHYGICAGRGKVFCIDRTSLEEINRLARRGQKPQERPRILALDARSGDLLWQSDRHVAGKLSYSEEHDVLVSGAAYRGKDGSLLWHRPENEDDLWAGKWGLIIRGQTIFTQGRRALDLLTGEPRTWEDAAGRSRPWTYPRTYGCSPMAGGRHLITFRSGCAGFLDLRHDGGTGNLGGFRSGCTSNLITADGVLNAPDYTRTCTCRYQNRSSLALVHMADAEYWTFGAMPTPGRIGFNFGAPGDRRAVDSTLWLAMPNVPDRSARDGTLWPRSRPAGSRGYLPRPLVATEPASPEAFYLHSSRLSGEGGWRWVAASGLVGLESACVPLEGIDIDRPFLVRLYFSEPEEAEAGARVFTVALDGKPILEGLDIFEESGGRMKTLVKEFPGIRYAGRKASGLPAIELTFEARTGTPLICGVEVVQ